MPAQSPCNDRGVTLFFTRYGRFKSLFFKSDLEGNGKCSPGTRTGESLAEFVP